MRIAFVLSEWPSASETFVAAQISGLLARGHEVHIFAEKPAAASADQGGVSRVCRPAQMPHRGRVRRWLALVRLIAASKPAGPGGFIRSVQFGRQPAVTALRYAAASQCAPCAYDIIHAHFGPNGIDAAAMRAAGVLSGRLVVTFHGYDLSQYLRERGERVYERLFEQADLCLPVTDRWKQRLIQLGCDPVKVRVHRMGVNTHGTAEVERPDAPFVRVLTTARLVEKKGIEYAIRAVALLARKIPLKYVIAGDGPDRLRLEALIRELGAGDSVSILGWCSEAEIRRLLSETDVFMLPSVQARNGDEEGLPVALMEAMCEGTPVLVTAHSGIPELVRNGIEGFLVPEFDVDGLAERLSDLALDVGLRRRMGTSGRLRITELHDNETLNDELVALYTDLTAAAAPTAFAGSPSGTGI